MFEYVEVKESFFVKFFKIVKELFQEVFGYSLKTEKAYFWVYFVLFG